jgi:hypothetical protein
MWSRRIKFVSKLVGFYEFRIWFSCVVAKDEDARFIGPKVQVEIGGWDYERLGCVRIQLVACQIFGLEGRSGIDGLVRGVGDEVDVSVGEFAADEA